MDSSPTGILPASMNVGTLGASANYQKLACRIMEGGEKLRLFQKGLSGIETWLNNQTNHARMIKIQSPASPSCVLKPTLLNFCHKNLRAALPVVFC